jgi:hypothetical protein
MTRRILGAVVLVAMALASACSTLGDYPSDWHSARNSIHVYGSLPARMIELPTSGQKITLLDLVLGLGETGGDLSRVVVFRRSGSGTTRFDVDVLDMVRTGNTSHNIVLQPGDVVGIAG